MRRYCAANSPRPVVAAGALVRSQVSPEVADSSSELDSLVVAGATFREIDTGQREELARVLADRVSGTSEGIVLHTCHRVELIAFGMQASDLSDVAGALHWSRGMAAAERMMLVAGGLDSAVLAEEQVLGQVRDAYRSALDRSETGPVTNELMRRAIRFGKRVRSFAYPVGDRSLADRAARWIEERLTSEPGRSVSALVVGTGEMGRLLARRLAEGNASVTVASRSSERGADVVMDLPHPDRHRASLIAEALGGVVQHDVVAIAVRGDAVLLDAQHLDGERAPLVVDLSSPSVVSREAATQLGERLLDLDRLGSTIEPGRLSADAERRLRGEARDEAQAFAAWLEVRASGDGIAMLRAHAEEVRRRHLQRLRLRSGLDEQQAAAVEAMTVAMLGELLHVPTVRLRRDPEAAARVRELFGIE